MSRHKDELAGLREAHQKANMELSSLRSKHAILREENCALYAKVSACLLGNNMIFIISLF